MSSGIHVDPDPAKPATGMVWVVRWHDSNIEDSGVAGIFQFESKARDMAKLLEFHSPEDRYFFCESFHIDGGF